MKRSRRDTGQKTTITQLARKLDLSVTTVSFVLSGRWRTFGIAPATADRVRRAAKDLKYIRNAMAQNLRQLKSNLVGIVFPHLRSDWAHRILTGMYELLQRNGKIPFIINHGENAEQEALQIDTLIQHRPDAFIINPIVKGIPTYRRLLQFDIPFVFISDALPEMPNITYAAWDPKKVATAVQHLIDSGRRRIGFVGIQDSRLVAQQRLKVYRETLAKAGLPTRKAWIIMPPPGTSLTTAIETTFVSSLQRPDALFCVYDDCAFAAYETFRKIGLRIPEDVAIAALGDSRAAGPLGYDLTVVTAPIEREGEQAATLALEQIKNPGKKLKPVIVHGGDLIIRGSSSG